MRASLRVRHAMASCARRGAAREREGERGQLGRGLGRGILRVSRHGTCFGTRNLSIGTDRPRSLEARVPDGLLGRCIASRRRNARAGGVAQLAPRRPSRRAHHLPRVFLDGGSRRETTVRCFWRRRAEPTAPVRRVPLGPRRCRTHSTCRPRDRRSSLQARNEPPALVALHVCGARRRATFRPRRCAVSRVAPISRRHLTSVARRVGDSRRETRRFFL